VETEGKSTTVVCRSFSWQTMRRPGSAILAVAAAARASTSSRLGEGLAATRRERVVANATRATDRSRTGTRWNTSTSRWTQTPGREPADDSTEHVAGSTEFRGQHNPDGILFFAKRDDVLVSNVGIHLASGQARGAYADVHAKLNSTATRWRVHVPVNPPGGWGAWRGFTWIPAALPKWPPPAPVRRKDVPAMQGRVVRRKPCGTSGSHARVLPRLIEPLVRSTVPMKDERTDDLLRRVGLGLAVSDSAHEFRQRRAGGRMSPQRRTCWR
jgi:hypothetical protein